MMMSDAPLLKLCDLWERRRRGNNPGTYIVAVAGGMKFLMLRKSREEPSTWTLFVTARADRWDQPTRGQRVGAGPHLRSKALTDADAVEAFRRLPRPGGRSSIRAPRPGRP